MSLVLILVSFKLIIALLLGGGSSEDVSADVEQKLDILHAFKDRSKSAVIIEQSPSGRYAAILDSHHRILIQVFNLLDPIDFKTFFPLYAR